jgi:hypothetical protein
LEGLSQKPYIHEVYIQMSYETFTRGRSALLLQFTAFSKGLELQQIQPNKYTRGRMALASKGVSQW